MAPPPTQRPTSRSIVYIIFLALLLDLLAFTIPLPLFPRLIEGFVKDEEVLASGAVGGKWATALEHLSPGVGSGARAGAGGKTLLQHTLTLTRSLRTTLFSLSLVPPTPQQQSRWDLTLLGGLLSSLFSFCQFLVSPYLGTWSDKYGRRKVLLASMLGNLASAAMWVTSASWGGYVASRLLSGLSEGNVQLSIACITDVTTPSERGKALALVGMAFGVAL